jgi:hypothetical protein
MNNEEQQGLYDEFIKNGLNAGFTDDQINFMWEYIMETMISFNKFRK